MKFKLEIDCDNAAFEDNPRTEVARILREVASKLVKQTLDPKLRDINGNVVGGAGFHRS